MSDDTYDVGYGKPPKHTRYKKGQSGNPKGRPKGTKNFSTDLRDMLEKPVSLREGAKTVTVSTQMAALLRLREKALRGDSKAMDKIIQLATQFSPEEFKADMDTPTSESDQRILDRYFERKLQQTQKGDRNDES